MRRRRGERRRGGGGEHGEVSQHRRGQPCQRQASPSDAYAGAAAAKANGLLLVRCWGLQEAEARLSKGSLATKENLEHSLDWKVTLVGAPISLRSFRRQEIR